MKLIKKKRILQIAEEAGLVFNTKEPYNFEIQPWHAKALYDFYMLIEEEKEKNAERANEEEVQDNPEPGDSEQTLQP